jgi:TPR repeat protein
MKRNVCVIAVLLLCVACNKNRPVSRENGLDGNDMAMWGDSVAEYRRGVEQRDSASFMKLIRCYHEGRGVVRSYSEMLKLLGRAQSEGYVIVEDYMAGFPEDDDFRILFDAMVDVKDKKYDEAYKKAVRLQEMGVPDGMFMEAVILFNKGEEQKARAMLEKAVRAGSQLAEKALEDIGRGE